MRVLLPLLAAATLTAQDSQRLKNILQLTHGGQNAETYPSPDGSSLEQVTGFGGFTSFAELSPDDGSSSSPRA